MTTPLSIVDHILNNAKPIGQDFETPSRPFIPADIDLSVPEVSVLSGARMMVPPVPKPIPSGAELLLSQPMIAPEMVAPVVPQGHIPADYDLMADLPTPSTTPLDVFKGATMSVPQVPGKETLLDVVSRTTFKLPSIGFGDAVKRVQDVNAPSNEQGLNR